MKLNEAIKTLKKHGYLVESQINKVDAETLYTLAFNTLLMADQVHVYHWSCDRGFQHGVFQTLYEGLRDFADELVELTLSSGVKFNYKLEKENIPTDEKFSVENAIKVLEDYNKELERIVNTDTFSKMKDIENCITDIITLISKQIGLLKHFK